jgi:hypothetical protein
METDAQVSRRPTVLLAMHLPAVSFLRVPPAKTILSVGFGR